MPNDSPRSRSAGADGGEFFVRSASPAMRALETAAEKVAMGGSPVLILGEDGVGKRCLAQQIHAMSGRQHGRFAEVACLDAAHDSFLPFDDKGHNGAGGPIGTVFVRHISDLPSAMQVDMLSFFFGRSSESSTRPRLLTSSTTSLDQEIRNGRFREDLYYLISGVCLQVPPLRHRREDILLLANHFLGVYSQVFARPKRDLSARLQQYFVEYAWPGNVRELKNAAKTVVAVDDEHVAMMVLRSNHSEGLARGVADSEGLSLKQAARAASRQAERELILKVLSRTRWNRKRAAQELQISYKALLYKLKQIGLDDEYLSSEETLA
jgi:two-component system, NtrC family, response regulator AtoC